MLKTSAFRFLKSPATDETPIRKKPPRCSWWFCPLATARKRSSWRRPNKAGKGLGKSRSTMKIFGKSKNGEKSWKSMDIYGKSWIYTWGIIELKNPGNTIVWFLFFQACYITPYHAIYIWESNLQNSPGVLTGSDPELPDFTSWGLSVTSWFIKIKPIDYSCIPLINPTKKKVMCVNLAITNQ